MKLQPNMSSARRQAGASLIECLVYIAVFAILLGGGSAAFYFCWDHTRAVISTAGEIESALCAGEAWRADVRTAKGGISIESTSAGEIIRIPSEGHEIIYRCVGDELRCEIPAKRQSRVVLAGVKASKMKAMQRNGITAWSWELELAPRHKEVHLPLLFTFEAAQLKP